jgi:hypothetical protein
MVIPSSNHRNNTIVLVVRELGLLPYTSSYIVVLKVEVD